MARRTFRPWVELLLEFYIFKILMTSPTYGNRISEELKKHTKGVACPNPNLLYPLLRKIENEGYIIGNWDSPDKRNRRIYHITQLGLDYFPELEQKAKEHFIQMEKNIAILRSCLFESEENP